MQSLIIYFILMGIVFEAQTCFALRKSRYQDLMVALDAYENPKESGRSMSRSEFFSQLNQRGLTLKVAKEDFKLAQESYRLTYDTYIPKPTLSSSYTYTESYSSSSVPTYARAFALGVAVGGQTPYGFTYSLDLPKATESTSRSSGSTTETDTFALGLTLTLNLLKGSYFFIGRNTLNSSDIDYQIARESMRSTSLQFNLQGEQSFYDVLLKQIRVRVLDLGFQSAKALLSDVREMIQAGEAEKLSAVKVELQLAQAETDLLAAQNELASSRQVLRDLMGLKETDTIYPNPNELKTLPAAPSLESTALIEKAKKQRPDFISAQLRLKKSQLDVQKAFAGILPKFDLKATYGYSKTKNTLALAASDAVKFNDPQYSVGLEFSYSFFNDSEKAAYRSSKINVVKADLSMAQLVSQISKEVTNAANSVDIGFRKVKTSGMSQDLSEKKLAAEFEKFKVGESNIRNIIDFQSEVNNARISEVTARIDYLKNLSQLKSVLGEFPEGVSNMP